MAEYIREIKITVEIETNKDTHQAEFDNIEDADKYIKELVDDLGLI